jgi:hypothetical protein
VANLLTIQDYNEARKHENESELAAWKRTRWQTWVLARALGADIKKPEDLLALEGDAKPRLLDAETLKKLYEKHGSY